MLNGCRMNVRRDTGIIDMNTLEQVARFYSDSKHGTDEHWERYIADVECIVCGLMHVSGDVIYDGAKDHRQYYDEVSEPRFRGALPIECDIAQFRHAWNAALKSILEGN